MPETTIVKQEISGGYIYLTDESGNRTRYPVAPLAANVPDLTIDSLTLLTKLAQVVMVLVQTLIENEVLDQSLVSGFDMDYILETLVDDHNAEVV